MWCDRGLNELQRFKRLVKACVTETRWLNHRFNEFVWAGRGWHWGLCDVELFKSLHSLDLWSVCLSSRREDGDQDHWLPKVPEMWCGCGKTVDDPKTQTVDSRRGAWAEPPDRKRLLKLPSSVSSTFPPSAARLRRTQVRAINTDSRCRAGKYCDAATCCEKKQSPGF